MVLHATSYAIAYLTQGDNSNQILTKIPCVMRMATMLRLQKDQSNSKNARQIIFKKWKIHIYFPWFPTMEEQV